MEIDTKNQNAHTFMEVMQHQSGKASRLLKALSHPDRFLLLCQLTVGEYCVTDLEEKVGISQPSLSQQLGILRKDNIVTTRRAGKQVFYSMSNDDVVAILNLLHDRFSAEKMV